MRGRLCISFTSWPLNFRMMSPLRIFALSAGPSSFTPGDHRPGRRPSGRGSRRYRASPAGCARRASRAADGRTPSAGRRCSCAMLAGIEKPMPIEPPEGEKIAVLMPITSPSMLNSGPPELPRLIAASVWMKSSYGPWRMSRPRAETMPAVTEPPRPNGLPIASTQSPTRSRVGVAELHRRQRLVGLDLQQARCRRVRRGRPPSP